MKWVVRPACVVPSITAIAKDASLREQLIDPDYSYRVTNGGDGGATFVQRRVSVVPESKPHSFFDAMNHCRNELTMPAETAEKTYARLLLRYDEPHPEDGGEETIDEKIDRIVRELDEIDASKTRSIRRSLAFSSDATLDAEDANLLQSANEKIRLYLSQLSRIKSLP